MDMSDPQHLPSYRRAGTNQMLSPWSPAPSSSRPRCLPRPPPTSPLPHGLTDGQTVPLLLPPQISKSILHSLPHPPRQVPP